MGLLLELGRRVCSPAAGRLRAALENPAAAQERLRRRLAAELARTEYGHHVGVHDVRDWDRIPVVDYEALQPWVERQKESRERILTPDPVLFWERTSGSTAPAKFVPYTAALRRAFTEMFLAWVHDVLESDLGIGEGRLYAAISPQLVPQGRTGAGVSVGTEDERDFLDGWVAWLLSPWLVDTARIARQRDPLQFRRRLALRLLRTWDLEVISVWSPSFLRVVLDELERNREVYQRNKSEHIGLPARFLRDGDTDWTAVWPQLRLVSCWDAGWARPQAAALRRRLRGVPVQGKGLLATEAPVTVPLLAAPGPVPLAHLVLLEFLDEAGRLHPLEDLDTGREYGLVLSQPAGFVRYRIGDRIRVVGRHLGSPCLEFAGRGPAVSDMVGEKLHETFVAAKLQGLGVDGASFRTLAPALEPFPRYRLLLERWSGDPAQLAEDLDAALSDAHHYQQARLLGQLAPAEVWVDPDMAERVAVARERAGVRRGDQKDRLLAGSPLELDAASGE